MTTIELSATDIATMPVDAIILTQEQFESWTHPKGNRLNRRARNRYGDAKKFMPRLGDGEAFLVHPQRSSGAPFGAILVVRDAPTLTVDELLASAFELADRHELSSVAVPLLRTGIDPYDLVQRPELVMDQTCQALRTLHEQAPAHPESVTLVYNSNYEQRILASNLTGVIDA